PDSRGQRQDRGTRKESTSNLPDEGLPFRRIWSDLCRRGAHIARRGSGGARLQWQGGGARGAQASARSSFLRGFLAAFFWAGADVPLVPAPAWAAPTGD